jgi:HPt (histidine-containing phosphotransfer) domain-containing protein
LSALSANATLPQVVDAAAPALDLSRLLELDPTGQNGLIARVLATYEASFRDLMGRLQRAADAQDQPGFFLAVHTLKSSSAYVGAEAMAQACAEVERTVRDQPGVGLPAQLARLGAVSAQVAAAVRQHLAAAQPEASA